MVGDAKGLRALRGSLRRSGIGVVQSWGSKRLNIDFVVVVGRDAPICCGGVICSEGAFPMQLGSISLVKEGVIDGGCNGVVAQICGMGGYQGYGTSGGNQNAYDGRSDSSRYMQPQSAAAYGGYGGGYGASDSSYGNPGVYDAVGGRTGSVPSSNASGQSGSELQGSGGSGNYMGSGYGDANGNSGYGNAAWRSEQAQASGNYGTPQGNGEQVGEMLDNGVLVGEEVVVVVGKSHRKMEVVVSEQEMSYCV
ncbi:unnamed protein product [Vicia faba]|uniref:Uncharacterized protein n=1 Tax=Vicia faba TaxID=3906 RepID=A0AAV1A8Z9_VICFA|nr:unnamed protein product [Vicia faba]